MKKVYYEAGPDEINIGPVTNQTQMKRGVPVEFDDKTADSLLAKPMFKEAKDAEGKRKTA